MQRHPLFRALAVTMAILLVPSTGICQKKKRDSGWGSPEAKVDSVQADDKEPVSVASDSCLTSVALGSADAKAQHSSPGWVIGGFFSGVALGLIGTGIITAVAASTDPKPQQVPPHVDGACYVSGYSDAAGTKNAWRAFGGGLAGTAVIVLIILGTSSE